jgi:hypothetical protein
MEITKMKDRFEELKKNTVSAKGQLKESSCVKFDNPEGRGLRVMFVGNSITLHAPAESIGWTGYWGMAASSKEKDYVHILENEINKTHPDSAFCICQVAAWERGYKNSAEILPIYAEARAFSADVIICRFVENVNPADYDSEAFIREYDELLKFLDEKGSAKFIVTAGFWHHPADSDILRYAERCGYPTAVLSDLGEMKEMKAVGLFENSGVANHPGDLGMKAIADRIMEKFRELKA